MARKSKTRYMKLLVLSTALFFLTACNHTSSTPPPPKKTSHTKLPKEKASLLHYLNHTDKKLGSHSAFYPLGDPRDAFAARIFLIDQAISSLDVQYYIYEDDSTGNFFSYHLYKAAQRGVKVRILLDDLITTGKDKELALLASHPNIELRLFNPNHLRRSLRNMALLFDIDRLGKRMHNKALIADGSAAIIGGRNIGDVYYAADDKVLFLDYDILAVGSVVPDIYRSFDLYWNSKEAVPAHEVLQGRYNPSEYRRVAQKFKADIAAFKQSPIGQAMARSDFLKKISNDTLEMTVAKRTDFYYDYPQKVNTDANDNRTHISSQVSEDLKRIKHNLIIISPYFIPGEELMKKIKALRKRNVMVTVVTNSLASTDVFPVYSGYRWYIKDLVQMGVVLYELKPQSLNRYLQKKKAKKRITASLHTKMMILDNDRLFVGSANVDPRSDKLNTETLMIISSKKLASAHKKEISGILNEKYFYRVTWGEHPMEPEDDGMVRYGPVWHSMEDSKDKVYYIPPHAGFLKTLGMDILSLFPIEGYL